MASLTSKIRRICCILMASALILSGTDATQLFAATTKTTSTANTSTKKKTTVASATTLTKKNLSTKSGVEAARVKNKSLKTITVSKSLAGKNVILSNTKVSESVTVNGGSKKSGKTTTVKLSGKSSVNKMIAKGNVSIVSAKNATLKCVSIRNTAGYVTIKGNVSNVSIPASTKNGVVEVNSSADKVTDKGANTNISFNNAEIGTYTSVGNKGSVTITGGSVKKLKNSGTSKTITIDKSTVASIVNTGTSDTIRITNSNIGSMNVSGTAGTVSISGTSVANVTVKDGSSTRFVVSGSEVNVFGRTSISYDSATGSTVVATQDAEGNNITTSIDKDNNITTSIDKGNDIVDDSSTSDIDKDNSNDGKSESKDKDDSKLTHSYKEDSITCTLCGAKKPVEELTWKNIKEILDDNQAEAFGLVKGTTICGGWLIIDTQTTAGGHDQLRIWNTSDQLADGSFVEWSDARDTCSGYYETFNNEVGIANLAISSCLLYVEEANDAHCINGLNYWTMTADWEEVESDSWNPRYIDPEGTAKVSETGYEKYAFCPAVWIGTADSSDDEPEDCGI